MTADAPGRVGRRTGATGAFGTGSYRASRRAAPRDFGPFDAADLDPALPDPPGLVDFGAVRVPVPDDGTVTVEPTANGRLQAVHVTLPGGRLSVSALAAPKSTELWPELVAEIDSSLRDGGARVRSFQGEWGRELHARTGAANSVFIGVDGARWMLYGVATGPAQHAVDLEAALREMLKGAVVDRGRSPYPVRTVLPLVVPEHLAGDDVVEDTPVSVPGPPVTRSASAEHPPPPAPEAATVVSRPRPPQRVEPPRAIPPPRVPVPPRVAADVTQALPVTPRRVHRPAAPPVRVEPVRAEPVRAEPVRAEPVRAEPVRAEPVRAELPRDRSVAEPPPPLWAAASGPVTAADLGPDPADDLPAGRPVNEVVTPTEWWPVPADLGADAAPPTERWPAVAAAVAPDREPDRRGSDGWGPEGWGSEGRGSEGRGSEGRGSEGRGSEGWGAEGWGAEGWDGAYRAEPAATPAERWVPTAEPAPYGRDADDRDFVPDRWVPESERWTPEADGWAADHGSAHLEPGPIELAAAAAVADAAAPATEWLPVVPAAEPEPSTRTAAPRRRRPAPEPDTAAPPHRAGRRRAPEVEPTGSDTTAPESRAERRNRYQAAGPTETRLADDTLDLAALVRSRSGHRRRAPDEPASELAPARTTGRRRAPEPADPPTEPLPVVRRPVTRDGSYPASAYLAGPPDVVPTRPGRHHRPG